MTTPRTKKTPLSAAKIKAYKKLAERIDAEEQEEIKALGRAFFKCHDIARQTVQSLKAKRLEIGMNLTELSFRTGIAKSNLSRLENNERFSPTLETLHRYAQALGLHMRVELN
ncbi:MAG: helix-turn-helix domain-containing protein [Phycisphaerales bacterium]|nr:helix-turn-helix domain-containing protein [Phycisphaerales bacterium]